MRHWDNISTPTKKVYFLNNNIKENSKLKPTCNYSKNKLITEKKIKEILPNKYLILRISNIIGKINKKTASRKVSITFIDNFYNYLDLEIDYSLLKSIEKKTGTSPLKEGNYFVKTPTNFLSLLKKFVPNYLKEKIKFLLTISLFKKILLRENVISKEDKEKLTELLIEENNLNEN